jgi:ABC-type cobalamin/Fe3+-siderophores transport system ATPase subunit
MNEQFLQFLDTSIKQLQLHKQIAVECEVDDVMIQLHDDIMDYCFKIKEIVESNNLVVNYVQLFQNDINNALGQLHYRGQQSLDFLQPTNKEQIKNNIEKFQEQFRNQVQSIHFNLDFFQKLSFFNKNIVAIGANGSGKTTLSNNLKKYLPKTGVVISAQKILVVPTFSSISNFVETKQKLKKEQQADKSFKTTYSIYSANSYSGMNSEHLYEFGTVLNNLISENDSTIKQYYKTLENGMVVKDKPKTKLDRALEIWNSLIQHRILECNDGINLTLKTILDASNYPAHQMSDGEKVSLYLIAQVLQAPQNGFIITDEPEMYLHKTILKKLWDVLENERQDCIFVYLTHDLDFATTRNAKKVWIKSYTTPPDKWEIEDIPENELPEALLLELLGSRKPILFCESQKGKNDEKIYNCLFPDYTITPVESCFAVINYTKTFNKIPNITTKAYGLIDSDHHSKERLDALKAENIFSLSVSEIENLLLQEDFLKLTAKEFKVTDEQSVEKIKNDIISELEKNIDLQVSNYITAKIDYYFKDSNVKKGNTLSEVINNHSEFVDKIKISDWYNERKLELECIVKDKNYARVLAVYNNKGLKSKVEKYFKISDFTDRAIRFLQSNKDAQNILLKIFPNEIKSNETK